MTAEKKKEKKVMEEKRPSLPEVMTVRKRPRTPGVTLNRLTTRNWSVPRETLIIIPTLELMGPPKDENPELAIYDTHTDTGWGGGGG